MLRFVAIVALAWGLVSCRPDVILPDRSTDPPASPGPTAGPGPTTPGRPTPTIEVPPPV